MKKFLEKLLIIFLVIILLIVTNVFTILVLKGKSKEKLSSNWKTEKLAATSASGWGTIEDVFFSVNSSSKTITVDIRRTPGPTVVGSPTIVYKWDSRASGVTVGEFPTANEISGTYKGLVSGADSYVYTVKYTGSNYGTFYLHVLVGGRVYASNYTITVTKCEALGHTEVIDEAVEATCTTAGKTEGKHCSVCGTVIVAQKTVAAKGHTEVIDKAVAATCTTAGKTEGKHCSVCSAVIVAQKTIAAKGHTEVTDKAVAATCTTAGKSEGKHCSVCNAVIVKQETIAAKGHTEVIDKAVAATCEAVGKTEGKHCSVCNKVIVAQQDIAAKGHTEAIERGVAPTCETAGKTERKYCSVCNKELKAQETIEALGHTEVIDKAVAATCERTGKTEGKHCSVCDKVLVVQEEIPKLEHNYENGECTNCGEKSEKITLQVENCEIKEKMITRVLQETKLKDLKIQTNATKIEVYNTENELVNENEKIATGMKLKLELNGQQEEYIFVVTGDLNGDGKMANTDLLRMVRYKAGLDKTLKGEYLEAADVIKDNKPCENNDILKLVRVLVGLDTL